MVFFEKAYGVKFLKRGGGCCKLLKGGGVDPLHAYDTPSTPMITSLLASLIYSDSHKEGFSSLSPIWDQF